MSSESIERPLLLNQSMKDSIQQPVEPSPIKQLEHSASRPEPEPIQEEAEDPSPQTLHQPRKDKDQEQLLLPRSFESAEKEEDVTYQIIEEQITPKKQKRRYKCMQTCGIVCLLIGIVMIFAIPPFLHSMIISQAIDKVVMQPQNQELWGHFPGQSATIIVRNFTFHRLMNEDDFLLRHQKPQFQEVTGFKIQELEDFLNITYLQDGNKVKVRDWTRFVEWDESRDLDTPVTILNMGNLGYWSTLKAARPTMILQQGLAMLFTNMEQSLLPTLIGTGLNTQFLPNSSAAFTSFLAPSGIEEQNFDFMWNDPSFGLSNPQNLGEWAQAALETYQNSTQPTYSPTANVIKNYFTLTDTQIKALLQKIYSYVLNLNSILLENHYCADIDMQNCTGRYLSVAQLTDGWVTASPPPVSTITPNDTICDNNFTCKGYYPELYAFEEHVFWGTDAALKMPSNSKITFKREQVEAWFNYNKTVTEGLDYNTAEDCLMHIGNLDQLWAWGVDYDMGYDVTAMTKIQQRLKLANETQAIVVWQWLKYLTTTFVKQKENTEKLGLANLFTQGLYSEFAKTQDTLQPFLLQKMLKEELKNKECHLFFQNTLEEPEGSPLVDSLCNHFTDIHSEEFASFMLSSCEEKYGPAWQSLRSLGVSFMTLEYHCQTDKDTNLGSIIHKFKLSLDQQYHCSMTPKPYCSNFELALQQWANSTITLNPPSKIQNVVEASPTFHDWNKDVKSFQYGFFLSKFNNTERRVFPLFSLQQLYPVFTFEQWFSATTVLRYIITGSFGDQFIRYLRWAAITVTLNGFTTTRTVREILFGYEDEFLAQIKNQYPPFGGDPSAPSLIALNDPNVTESQASMQIVFKTGKDDFRNVYQNYQINGYQYSVNNYSWFDGNKTDWAWQSPWAENDYFYGTTAKIFAPNQFEADNLSLFINQVQRYGSNFFHNESFLRPRYGIDLYISYLSPYIGQVAPHNDKYYQTLPNVFNVSSIYGLPLYITKNHFMNCTQWLELVDIYNEDYSIRYQDISQWDDTFILVQPYTGVSFQSQIYLQNNYFHQPDVLYPYPVETMLPIFTISRSGNLTEDKFHELYDPLVIGLKMRTAMVYVGVAFVLVFGGMLVFAIYKKKHIKKREKMISQLGISLQEQIKRKGNDSEGRLTLEVEE